MARVVDGNCDKEMKIKILMHSCSLVWRMSSLKLWFMFCFITEYCEFDGLDYDRNIVIVVLTDICIVINTDTICKIQSLSVMSNTAR